MTDLVLLLPDRAGRLPDARVVRSIVEARQATVASVGLPGVNPDGSLDRRAFADLHHQHGVDLSAIGPAFKPRDVILVKTPDGGHEPLVNFYLLLLWNWPGSTYDIDSVRIPHATRTDKRNNPRGKNPGNVWVFPAGGLGGALLCGLDAGAVHRLIACHTGAGDAVHAWAAGEDVVCIEALADNLGRRFSLIPPGDPDPLVDVPIEVAGPAMALDGLGGSSTSRRVEQGGKDDPPARYFIQDAVTGIPRHVDVPIDDMVTSPPYNIGYDPFNVPKPDPRSGRLVAPRKAGYKDDLPRAAYHGMIKRTLAAVDARMGTGSSDAFINMKNSYSGGVCNPPFWILKLVPPGWLLSDVLVWRYDISYDPARGKYKPYYEWILRFTKGAIRHPPGHRYLQDHYIPILKGNSRERAGLVHPAIYPKEVVKTCLAASGHDGLVVDPFLGSGTTIAAAWEQGRPSIGFEIDERYVPDIEARLSRAARPAKGSIAPGGGSA